MKHLEKRKSVNHIMQKGLDITGNQFAHFLERSGIPVELLRKTPYSYPDKKDVHSSVPKLTDVMRPDWVEMQENEFSAYFKNLLVESKYFCAVKPGEGIEKGPPVQSIIVAKIKTGMNWEPILIQCKSDASFSMEHLASLIKEIRVYQEMVRINRFVLAFPGRVSRKTKQLAREAGIELWDIDFIATNFPKEIRCVKNPVYQPLFKSYYTVFPGSRAEYYIRTLQSCEYGKENLPAYKKLIGEIIKYLFHPPLELPISEQFENSKTNNGYLIIPNYASEGFWKFLRETYRADYIIVDVKNYKGKVKKRDVILLSNHLRFHGAGLFGIIIARNDQDVNCLQSLKEQWVVDSKLIVVLSDEHVEEMILAKSSGGSAELILGRIIENFRISL